MFMKLSDRDAFGRPNKYRSLGLAGFLAAPAPASTSYSGTYSTGDRRASITFSTDVPNLTNNCIDGNVSNNQYSGTNIYIGKHITFEFPEQVWIDEFKFYNDKTSGRTEGEWELRGSNNGSDWTVLDESTIFAYSANPSIHTVDSPGWYTYLRLYAIDNAVTGNCAFGEFEFKTN